MFSFKSGKKTVTIDNVSFVTSKHGRVYCEGHGEKDETPFTSEKGSGYNSMEALIEMLEKTRKTLTEDK